MTDTIRSDRARLRAIAVRAMRERGLEPDYAAGRARRGRRRSTDAPRTTEEPTRDLRTLLWCSIDNDDSRDLDQLSVAEALPDGGVDGAGRHRRRRRARSPKGSPIDRHAAHEHDVGLHAGA